MCLLILWFPLLIIFLIQDNFGLSIRDDLYYPFLVTQIASSLYGIATFLIYFYSSRQARHSWYILLTEFSTQATPLQLDELVYRQSNMSNMSDNSSIIITDNDMFLRPSEFSVSRPLRISSVVQIQHNNVNVTDRATNDLYDRYAGSFAAPKGNIKQVIKQHEMHL